MTSSQNELSHATTTSRKKEAADLHHPLKKEKVEQTFWDTDYFETSDIEDIEDRFGDAAPAYYQRLALRILREGGYIRFDAAVGILKKKSIGQRAEEFVNYCVGIGLLYRDGAYLRSGRADREIEKLSSKRDEWRKRKRIQKDSPKPPQEFPQESHENPQGIPQDSEEEGKGREQEGKGREEEPEREPDPEQAEYERLAQENLLAADHPDVVMNPAFLGAGRRRHKRFREIWLTPREYGDVLRQYTEAGVAHKIKDQVEKAAAKLRTLEGEGKALHTIAVHVWLTGYLLQEAKNAKIADLKIEREEQYLKNAKNGTR